MYYRLPLVFLLILSVAGCDSAEPAAPSSPVPLAVGNAWTYQVAFRDEPPTDTFEVAIIDRVALDDLGPRVSPEEPDSASVWAARFDGVSTPFRWLWAEGPGGLYAAGGIAPTDTARTWGLAYEYPAREGSKAPLLRLAYSLDTGDYYAQEPAVSQTLVATDEPFETPAGTFQTHVYLYNFMPADDVNVTWNVYRYVAPGVGLVGQVIRDVDLISGEEEDVPPYQTMLLVERTTGAGHAEDLGADGFGTVQPASALGEHVMPPSSPLLVNPFSAPVHRYDPR